MVNYLEREAAEGSEAGAEIAASASDQRFRRMASTGEDAYTSVKLTPSSPLVPLEQLLQQEDFSGMKSGLKFCGTVKA